MTIATYKILKDVYKNLDDFKEAWNENQAFKPLDVEIRLNWVCNFSCEMCGLEDYIAGQEKSRQYQMKFDEVRKLLDELALLGCQAVTFSGGEATLRKDLPEIIEHAANKCKMTVSMNTNGSMLDEDKLLRLIRNGLKNITFSMDSPDPSVHDEIRKHNGNHAQIVSHIQTINQYNETSGQKVYVFINSVVMKKNILSLVGFRDLYKQCKFDYLTFTPASIATPWDEWTAKSEHIRATREDVLKFKKQVLPVLREAGWPFEIIDPFGDDQEEIEQNLYSIFSKRPIDCYVSITHAVIQCNGDLIPCCYAPDQYSMGNVLDNSFVSVWTNDKYQEFRRGCKGIKYDMCKSCRQYVKINSEVGHKLSK